MHVSVFIGIVPLVLTHTIIPGLVRVRSFRVPVSFASIPRAFRGVSRASADISRVFTRALFA